MAKSRQAPACRKAGGRRPAGRSVPSFDLVEPETLFDDQEPSDQPQAAERYNAVGLYRYSSGLQFLVQVCSKYPVLTPEENLALARRIQQGSTPVFDGRPRQKKQRIADYYIRTPDAQIARDLIVRHNLRLIISIASRVLRGRTFPLDLEQAVAAGAIGFLRGVDGFEPERGVRLSTYVSFWVKQSVQRAMHDVMLCHVPEHVINALSLAVRYSHEQGLDFDDALVLVAGGKQLYLERLRVASGHRLGMYSLDVPAKTDDPSTFKDLVAEDALGHLGFRAKQEYAQEFGRAAVYIFALRERERQVVSLRLLDYTLGEIGGNFGVCRERVRQIETRANKLLREMRRLDEEEEIIRSTPSVSFEEFLQVVRFPISGESERIVALRNEVKEKAEVLKGLVVLTPNGLRLKTAKRVKIKKKRVTRTPVSSWLCQPQELNEETLSMFSAWREAASTTGTRYLDYAALVRTIGEKAAEEAFATLFLHGLVISTGTPGQWAVAPGHRNETVSPKYAALLALLESVRLRLNNAREAIQSLVVEGQAVGERPIGDLDMQERRYDRLRVRLLTDYVENGRLRPSEIREIVRLRDQTA